MGGHPKNLGYKARTSGKKKHSDEEGGGGVIMCNRDYLSNPTTTTPNPPLSLPLNQP